MLEQLIKKGGLQRLATAIPATSATEAAKMPPSVARVATVAVATTHEIEVGSPAVCPVNFAERAAILEADGDLSRDEAEQAAALELGHVNAVALYEATTAGWQQHLHRIDTIAATQRAKEVISDAHAFLSEWGLTALQMGWDEQDLFRCTSHDLEAILSSYGKRPQLQRLGLIFFLHGGRVEFITRESASIRTIGGQLQTFPRYGPGHNQGVPIWSIVRDTQSN